MQDVHLDNLPEDADQLYQLILERATELQYLPKRSNLLIRNITEQHLLEAYHIDCEGTIRNVAVCPSIVDSCRV